MTGSDNFVFIQISQPELSSAPQLASPSVQESKYLTYSSVLSCVLLPFSKVGPWSYMAAISSGSTCKRISKNANEES